MHKIAVNEHLFNGTVPNGRTGAVRGDMRLLVRVAEMYYRDGLTQQKIAEALHLSRPKVCRLLDTASRAGIVQIRIVDPFGGLPALEEALCARYGLREAVVARGGENGDRKVVGAAGALYLEKLARDGMTLGVSWGTTLQALVDELYPAPHRDITVLQMLGGVGQAEGDFHANELARRMAEAFGGRWFLLPAPVVVSDRRVRDALLAERRLAEVMERFESIDIALVGIGSLEGSILHGTGCISTSELDELRCLGAVGDVCSFFFDAAGRLCRTPLHDRVVGITPDRLRSVDRVVGVAAGRDKLEAIRGALLGKMVNVLVTDEVTAGMLLE